MCDVATALVPQFLLWGVQMRSRTKRQLNVLFGLGLITAALSIARAATITKKTLNDDPTCRFALTTHYFLHTDSSKGNMVSSYYFGSFEGNLGIILACGPAIRQFWAYRTRTQTSLPSKHRQNPNGDFEKMRYRINLRDIFWYRKAHTVGNRVFDASPIFRSNSPPPDGSSSNAQTSSQVRNSALDSWEKWMKKLFGAGRDNKVMCPRERHFSPYSRKISTDNQSGRFV